MLNHKRVAMTLGLIVIASMMLSACAPTAPLATSIPATAQVIIQTQIVEVAGTPEVQEVVVTATPEPVEAVTHYTDDPTTFTELLFGSHLVLFPFVLRRAHTASSFSALARVCLDMARLPRTLSSTR